MKFSLAKTLKGFAFFLVAGVFVPMIGYGLDDCSTLMSYNIPTEECDILVDFYNSMEGSGWMTSTDWLADVDACDWFGVNCVDVGGQDHVQTIELAGNNLSGALPDSLSGLVHLTTLDFSNNTSIYGVLPTAWSTLTGLTYFAMAYNQNLSGTLPDSRSAMTEMSTFFIQDNNVSGPLPESWSAWTKMYYFDVALNNITGPLPEGYSTWTGLNLFNIQENYLSGSFPASRSGWEAIQTFNAYDNTGITGILPPERESWGSTIQSFRIGSDSMTGGVSGQLPEEWSTWMGIDSFQVFGSQLTGTLPDARSGWVSIRYFTIENTPMGGSVPASRGVWTNLDELKIQNTYIHGVFDDAFAFDVGSLNLYIDDNCFMTTGISLDIDGWYRGNSLSDRTVQKDCLEIAIEKSVDIDDGNPGEEIVFTIDYTIGSGTNTSGTVSIFDIWPEGLTFVSSTPSETETTYSGEFAYEWIITPIPGTAGEIEITAYIDEDAEEGASIVNNAVAYREDVELETADNESSLELIVTLPTSEGSNGRSSSIDDDDLEDAQDDYYDNQDNNDRDDDRDDDDNETDEDDGLTPDGNNSDAASHAKNDCSDNETNDAYAYARGLNITTIQSCTEAQPDGILLRKHAAKMLSEFAVNVLGNEPDEYLSCLFVDMYSEDEEMQYYAKRACQLGLMGLDGEGKPVHTFSPNEPMTVAQLGTVISRILRGDTYNTDSACWYCDHLKALKGDGIMTKIDQPHNNVLRGWVWIMLERISENY